MASEKIGSIKYELDLDDDKFKKGAATASSNLQGLTKQFEAAERGSMMLLTAITAVAAGVLALGINALQTAGQMETARAGFITLLGSAQKADKTIARIKKEAAATPFEIPGLTKATQGLALITKDGDKAIDIVLDVGKALAAAGKGQAELDRIIGNLQQMALTGKITEMDLRQFGTSGINIMELLGKHFGKTTAQIAVMQDKGKIGFNDLVAALHKAGTAGGQFENAFANAGGTFEQTLSNLNDTWNTFLSGLIVSSGIFDGVKQIMSQVTSELGRLSKRIEEAGSLTKFLNQQFADNKEKIYIVAGAILGALVPAFVGLAGSIWATLAPLLPFILAGAAIAAIVYKLQEAFGGWQPFLDAIKNAFQQLWNIIAPFIVPMLKELWRVISEELWPALQKLWTSLQPDIIEALKLFAMILGGMLLASIMSILAVLIVLAKIITFVAEQLRIFIDNQKQKFEESRKRFEEWKDGIGKALNLIKGFFEDLKRNIDLIIDGIKNILKPVHDAIVQPFLDAFGKVEARGDQFHRNVSKDLSAFARQSPSLVDIVKSGTKAIEGLYGGMFSNLNTMSAEAHLGLSAGMTSMGSTMARSDSPIASAPTIIQVNPSGIIARSRSELREITRDMMEAVNEDLRSRGIKEIGDGKLLTQ